MGEVVRQSVRNFAEFGKIDEMVEEGEEDTRVYDQFSAPPISKGIGVTENMVFVDGDHSLVWIFFVLIVLLIERSLILWKKYNRNIYTFLILYNLEIML